MARKKRNFCEIHPVCYEISYRKEVCKRHIKDLVSKDKFTKERKSRKLPVLLWEHSSNLIKRGPGIDIRLQENKAVNIKKACGRITGMVIHPGEVFSFWKTVGNTSSKNGYKDGRVIINDEVKPGAGGGLCNLANTINLLALHSPLDVTEFHKHSDALAWDGGHRVPLSAGTSVYYNYLDYRFKNNTDQDLQLVLWCDKEKSYGELRCEKEIPYRYEITEEDHHFEREGDQYYRVSRIYKDTIEKSTGNRVKRELIWDNRSLVMYDHSLIPKEQIRE